jgi:hypothetical protein
MPIQTAIVVDFLLEAAEGSQASKNRQAKTVKYAILKEKARLNPAFIPMEPLMAVTLNSSTMSFAAQLVVLLIAHRPPRYQ